MATLKIPILDLKPAQIAIGMLEVEHKMAEYAHLSKDEFHAYSEQRPVPVVQSSHGHYIIDHHHLCRAYHELGHRHVHISPQADFSGVDEPRFWAMMAAASWVLPQDQYGVLHPCHHLPMDIRGMADDPYRSLVWRLKELGWWQKVEVPFAEFKVANFLRAQIPIRNTKESFDLAVTAAIRYLEALSPGQLAQVPGLARPVTGRN